MDVPGTELEVSLSGAEDDSNKDKLFICEGNLDRDDKIQITYCTEGGDSNEYDENALTDQEPNSIPTIEELQDSNDNINTDVLLSYMQEYEYLVNNLRNEIEFMRVTNNETVRQSRGSIVELHNKMFKKLLEAEFEQEQKIEEYEDIINNLQQKIRMYDMTSIINEQNDRKLSGSLMDENSLTAEKRGSLSNFTTNQFQKLLDQESEYHKETQSLLKTVKDLEDDLSIERLKNEELNACHRQSISTLHSNMFKKLLEAEDDYEEEVECEIHISIFVCVCMMIDS